MRNSQQFHPEFENLAHRFIDQVRNQPNLEIYTFLNETTEEKLSLLALSNKVDSVINLLNDYCEIGDRAILVFKPGLDFIAGFLACLLSGVVAVPIYPVGKNKTRHEALYRVINDCQPKCILADGVIGTHLKDHEFPDDMQCPVVSTDTISIKSNKPNYYSARLDDIAFLQYTSGSTGNPKGVIITHENLLANQRQIQGVSGHDQNCIGVSWLPPYHDMGLIGGILQPLFVGFPVILMAPATFVAKPLKWLQSISDYQATTSCAPNFAFDLCVKRINAEQAARLDLSRLSVLFNGAEPISLTTINAFSDHFRSSGFKKEAFLPCYGMAETTLIVSGRQGIETVNVDGEALTQHTGNHYERTKSTSQFISCGYPVNGLDVAIVNSSTGERVPAGQVSEIWVNGSNVAAGYWNKPELSRETFSASLKGDARRWLKTGDLGFIHDKQLFISGRQKELIIIRGRNYYPQDIENISSRHFKEIKANSVAAFSFKTKANSDDAIVSTHEEQLAIVCELERNALRGADYQDLCMAINKQIANKLEIQAYSIVLIKPASIPKTTSGKIRRLECCNQFLEGRLSSVHQWDNPIFHAPLRKASEPVNTISSASPQDVLAAWMQRCLAEHLNAAEPVDLSQHFEDYGMDSLQAASFVGDISEHIGFDIRIDILGEYQTISDLSRYLSSICAIKQGLAQLKDTEKQLMLTMIEQSVGQKESFSVADIPKKFYCFSEYPPNKALISRNALLDGAKVNPFFAVINGANNNCITIANRNYINFSSNDFLGLNSHPEVIDEVLLKIKELGTSVSASRLVSGEKALHRELESKIAGLINAEAAMVFVGAATTNVSTIGHLCNKNDLILYDELSHESLAQGAELSHATARPFKHNDFHDLEKLLQKSRGHYEKVLIFVEGLYSMDGDAPNLKEFIRIKKEYKCWMMVDECLSIGVLGAAGGGISDEQAIDPADVDIWMGGLSKAFASCGGYIAGKRELVNYLKYTCPGFVFTTGISPANAAAASKAISVIKGNHEPVIDLRRNAQLFLRLAQEKTLNTGLCQGFSIVPIIVGDSKRCIEIYKGLLEDGINVQPILYPAVAEGSARFRFSLTALHTEEQIKFAIDCLDKRINNRPKPLNTRG